MTNIFDGELWVHYGFFFLQPAGGSPDLMAARVGQVNGLCGAAVPGALSLVTGTHTGLVPLVVQVLPDEPPVGPEWQDVVEVSFQTAVIELGLAAFQDWVDLPPLPGLGSYRVRYSATGLDAAHQRDGRQRGDPVVDSYLLQLWPAPAAPEVIVRQVSGSADYWHRAAREAAPPTAEKLAAARAAEQERQRREQELRRLGQGQQH